MPIPPIPPTNFLDVWKRFLKNQQLWFHRPWIRWPLAGVLFLVVAVTIFSLTSRSSYNGTLARLPLFGSLQNLLHGNEPVLQGEAEGRVNMLLLGIGGEQHQGGLLADTIMLASLNTKTQESVLLSIPRDLVVPINGFGWRKVNTIDAFAELNEKGSGGRKSIETLSALLQIPIHYYIRLDFAGFQKMIDDLDGIYVTVENTLDDPKYPITGQENAYPVELRYEHLIIPTGPQWFDGTTALKYVRSRKGRGKEGSDFARARRQQRVLLAVRERALSFTTLIRPQRVATAIQTLGNNLSTNLSIREMIRLASFAKNISESQVKTIVLDIKPDGYLVENRIDGAFILEPREGNFDRIRNLVQHIFDPVSKSQEELVKAPPRIVIQNGTTVNGLAATKADLLQKRGFHIIRIANAEKQTVEKTTVIDFTNGEREEDLARLREVVQSDVLRTTSIATNDAIDFLLVLGKNALIER